MPQHKGGKSFGSPYKGSRFNKPKFGHKRPFHGGGRPGGSRGYKPGVFSDISKFINKAVITEAVEHFVPEHQFTDFLIEESLKKNIVSKGYVTPTPIQDRS